MAVDVLGALDLPLAPPVTRVAAAPVVRPGAPALVLLVLGVLLVVGPIAGGLFSKVAAGKQMIDAFAPHMTTDSLARYDADVATIGDGAAGVKSVYASQHVAKGRFAGLDEFRAKATDIEVRASTLLAEVRA